MKLISIMGAPLTQSCVSPKTVEMKFQFRKEEKIAQICIAIKTFHSKRL